MAVLIICSTGFAQQASAADPPGTWLLGEKVAIEIFDCSDQLCGRVVWLKEPLDRQGLLKRDKHNPDPAQRQRPICGPTIIWNLRPIPPNRWAGGWFYNPNDGITYRVTIELTSADALAAHIYLGYPVFGITRTLVRVAQGTSEGRC